MFPNAKASERVAVLDVIDPVSQAAGTVTTGWLSVGQFEHVLAMLQVGALGASATVDAKLQQAQKSDGTGSKDVAGKAITQLTKAGADDNKQVLIDLAAEDLDVEGGFSYVRLSVTVAVAACLVSASVLGFDARYFPAYTSNANSVDEIVA
jgi:hypothetical protein